MVSIVYNSCIVLKILSDNPVVTLVECESRILNSEFEPQQDQFFFLFDQDCLLTQRILHPEVKIGTGQMLGRPEDILGITTPQLCESGVIYLVLGTRGNSPISPQPPFPLTSSHRVTLAELPKLL